MGIPDALQELAPVIAIWSFGVSIMFNGLNWSRGGHARRFGWWVFGCGGVIVAAGLVAYAAYDVFNPIALLAAILVVGLMVGLGWRFARKDP